jgi:hypothetical protein
MAIFTSVVAAVAVTAAQDVFEITAPSNSNVLIRDIKIGQYSDFGDAAAEILSVTVIRGYTVSGSGGSASTPSNLKSVGPAAVSSVEINNTTVANTGSAVTLIADAFNIQAGWSLRDVLSLPDAARDPKLGIWLAPSERLVVRITAPADSLTMNATLVFEETGIVC